MYTVLLATLVATPEQIHAARQRWASVRGEGHWFDIAHAAVAHDSAHPEHHGHAVRDLGPFANPVFRVRAVDYTVRGIGDDVQPGLPSVNLVNLMQNPQFFSSRSSMAPRLLRHSFLFDTVTQNEVLPLQHFLIQGWPAPCFADERQSRYFPFPDILPSLDAVAASSDEEEDIEEQIDEMIDMDCVQKLTDREVRSVTGDGFHWASVGAMLAFAWSTGTYQPRAP